VGIIRNYGDLMYSIMSNIEGAANAVLKKGDQFTYYYRINYGREIPAPPKLISLKFYDYELCDP